MEKSAPIGLPRAVAKDGTVERRSIREILKEDPKGVARVKKNLHLRTDVEAARSIQRWVG